MTLGYEERMSTRALREEYDLSQRSLNAMQGKDEQGYNAAVVEAESEA